MPTHPDSPALGVPLFREITGAADPYPWQVRLFQALTEGKAPQSLDIPTGLGKTAVVVLYLLALAEGAPLPRRLAYVVDRRAIVDQTAVAIRTWVERIATIEPLARRFDDLAAFPAPAPITVGVLRGGLADDSEWRVDPARPAVVIGTVDMIGSRLLFSGYGDGLSRRPLHAGLLGHDTFLLLDEADLSPGMAGLIRGIERLRSDGDRPGFRALTLSATPDTPDQPFGLDDADLANAELYRRFTADKAILLETADDNVQRVERMVDLARSFETGSVLIYTRTVRDARKIATKLAKDLGDEASDRLGLLTGTLRGFERENLGRSALWAAFDPARERDPTTPARFLVSTSAGEVGVDLDADHAVLDLATLDAMIQRLGRINRTGRGAAKVHVVATQKETEPPKPKDNAKLKDKPTPGDRLALAIHRTYGVLRGLRNGSPETLRLIPAQDRQDATTPRAEPVPLNAATVECFAATTARIGMPDLDLFLRGNSDERDIPDTYLVWRWDTPQLVAAGEAAAADVISLFRPEPREVARVPVGEARELLAAAATRHNPLPVLVRDARGNVSALEIRSSLSAMSTTILMPGGVGQTVAQPACFQGQEYRWVGEPRYVRVWRPAPRSAFATRSPHRSGADFPTPLGEWLDGISHELCISPTPVSGLLPLRHFSNTLAPTPTRGLPALAPISMAGSGRWIQTVRTPSPHGQSSSR